MINLSALQKLFKHDEVENWLKTVKGEGKKCFRTQMKLYVPTCYGQCELEANELINEVNKIYEGSTIYKAEGSWITPEGRTETEPIKVVEIGHDCTEYEEAKRLGEAIVKYATKTNQQAISILQGRFYIGQTPEVVKAFKKKFGET